MTQPLIIQEICPRCGGSMRQRRFGIPVTPLWALIIDRIKVAGSVGVEGWELRSFIEENTGRRNNVRTLSTTIGLINQHIEDVGYRIRNYKTGGKDTQQWFYYLCKTE